MFTCLLSFIHLFQIVSGISCLARLCLYLAVGGKKISMEEEQRDDAHLNAMINSLCTIWGD